MNMHAKRGENTGKMFDGAHHSPSCSDAGAPSAAASTEIISPPARMCSHEI